MLKYLIYIGVGYLVYRVAKSGFRLLLSNYQQPKELHEPSELIKCNECGSFVGEGIALKKGKLIFCSEDCFQKHEKKDSQS